MEPPDLSGIHVLIVDHDTEHIRRLDTELSRRGAHTRTATSLAAARRALGEEGADIVITELWLRDGPGTELLRSIREEETRVGRRCIVVAVALLTIGHPAVRRAGFDGFFAKAAPIGDLLIATEALISVYAKR